MLIKFARVFFLDDNGNALIEYALIAGLIAVVCITALRGLANNINNALNNVSNAISS